MYNFTYLWVFWLLPLPIVIIYSSLTYKSYRTSLKISFMEDIDTINGNRVDSISRATFAQKALLVLVWILIIISLSKPQFIGKPIEKEISQREILVAIDLSGSMSTKDFVTKDGKTVDRLQAVKEVLSTFFKNREGEKIGLILFGSSAFVQAPFTQDLEALNMLLSQLEVGMAGPKTMLGDGIALGVKMFRENNISDRMLILMSDGDDTGSRVPPKVSAKLARENDVTIYSIAIGDPQNAGEHPLDTKMLQDISSSTGGKFYYALKSKELVKIYDEIDKLEPKKVLKLTHRPVKELFSYPLALAFLLMFLYGVYILVSSVLRSRK